MSIETKKFLAVLTELGINHYKQSAFWKCEGPKGRRLYIADTKKTGQCSRIDLSGFEVDFGVANLGGESFGKVKQQLVFTTEAETLENFRKIAAHMLTLTAVEKVPVAPKPKKEKGESNVTTVASPEMTMDAKAKKLALIRQIAAANGVAVSSKTEAELGS